LNFLKKGFDNPIFWCYFRYLIFEVFVFRIKILKIIIQDLIKRFEKR